VFDDVTKNEGGERVARRVRYLIGSAAVQVAAMAVVAFLAARMRASVAEGPVVPVTIVRSVTTSGPPLLPPAPRREEVAGSGTPPKPKREDPQPRPRSRRAMVQPKAVPPEPEEDRSAPSEEESEGDDGPRGEETLGGVVAGAISGSALGDAPAYAGAGWKRPEQAQRNCVQNSVRIPRGLQGFASGPITVKFAVGSDGAPCEFQVLGDVPDARIGAAVWQAVQACRWIPGADMQGRLAKIWVTMPIRFVSR
jgi:protein TonB